AARCPAWTCAARRFGGDVSVSVEKPNPASLVGMMPPGGTRLLGSSGQPLKTLTPLGSASAAAEPTMPKSPANGAGMPPNASQGVEVCRFASAVVAWPAVIGVGLLEPSIRTRPSRARAPGLALKSQV